MRFTGFGWNLVDKSDTIRYDTRCCFNVPWTRTSIGQRSYAVYDSRTWNRLPTALRSPELSLALFKRQLKTHRSVPALDSAVCRCGCRVPSSHRRCCDCTASSAPSLQMSRLDSTVQPPRITRSLVTIACPSTSSSLRITDRSFQYASPRLCNQFPGFSPSTTHYNLSNSDSPSSLSGTFTIGSINSPLSSSIIHSLFHSTLKTFLSCKAFPS